MKTALTLLIVFLFNVELSAQCDYLSKEIDDFTGEKNVTLMPRSVYFYERGRESGKVDFMLMSHKGEKFVGVMLVYMDGDAKCFNSNSKLLIKKTDGTIIELYGEEQITCSQYNGATSSIIGAFSIDDLQLEELNEGIDKFQLSFSETYLDGTFGPIDKTYGIGALRSGPKKYNSKLYFAEMTQCLNNGLNEL